MKKLRLILTRDCHKDCEGCCNKIPQFSKENTSKWDWKFEGFDEIILTGGEPMLQPSIPYSFLITMSLWNYNIPTYMYSAYANHDYDMWWRLLRYLKGITFTIHNQEDVDDFMRLNFFLAPFKRYILDNNKSMQLHVFKGIKLNIVTNPFWKIKDNIEWIKDCPLPENEILKEL